MTVRKIRRKDGIIQRYHVGARWRWIPEAPYRTVKQKLRLLPLEDIQLTEVDNPKRLAHLCKDVGKIRKIMDSGPIKKPVKVHGKYWPGQKYQLWDGHHRYIAALWRGDKTIPAIIDDNPTQRQLERERKGRRT